MDIKEFIKLPEEYFFNYSEGIYQVLEPEFKKRLDVFLLQFLSIQQKEKRPYLPQHQIAAFPFVDFKPFEREIALRKGDLDILETLWNGGYKPKTVLEIGGWNGWLTSWLLRKNCCIVSADIFSDETNGLATKKFHEKNQWLSVQTDLTNTSIYQKKFDLIIFNHCLQFFPDPLSLLDEYKQLLVADGKIIILGASFHRLEKRQTAKRRRFKEHYLKNYLFDVHFYPTKGFFTIGDYKKVINLGFRLIPYKFALLGTLKRKITGEKSGVLYF